jgi:hypothetical protein
MDNHVGLELVLFASVGSTHNKVVVSAFNPFYFGVKLNIYPQSPCPFYELLDKIRVEFLERPVGAM